MFGDLVTINPSIKGWDSGTYGLFNTVQIRNDKLKTSPPSFGRFSFLFVITVAIIDCCYTRLYMVQNL
jgi:hypothetical protein